MGLLTELVSLKEVADAVELLDVDVLDFEHLELDNGRDFVLAVVTGEHAQAAASLLERLKTASPSTAGTAVQSVCVDDDVAQLIELLQKWHGSRIQKLEMLASAGPEVSIQAKSPDGKPLELDKSMRIGLMVGVDLALEMFRALPLTVTPAISDEEE